jgi:hypothetical protein
MRRACMQFINVGEGWRRSNAGGPKQWLMRSAFSLAESAVRFDA